MYETEQDLADLQALLDRSYATAGQHLRSIFSPQRRMSAAELVDLLRGVCVLNVATVSAACTPMVAPVDGLFYRGKLLFGFPPGAVRARHARARPQVSAVHHRGEEHCVIVHGQAREIDLESPDGREFLDYFQEVYGDSWDYWHGERYRDREGTGFNAWIEARQIFTLQPALGSNAGR